MDDGSSFLRIFFISLSFCLRMLLTTVLPFWQMYWNSASSEYYLVRDVCSTTRASDSSSTPNADMFRLFDLCYSSVIVIL